MTDTVRGTASLHDLKGKQAMRGSGGMPRSSWRDFLASVRAGDLIKDNFRLMCIDSDDTVSEALECLKEHDIESAPVWNRQLNTFLGFMDVLDIVYLIFDKLSKEEILSEKSSNHAKTSKLLIQEATNISNRNPWCPVYIGKPLLSIMDMFSAGGHLHRIPISDEQGKIVSIVSQAKVVEFLSSVIDKFGNAANKTVAECFSAKEVECVHFEDLVIDAFLKMKDKALAGLAVVDDAGALVGNISAGDMKSVIIDDLYADLKEPVGGIMKRSAEINNRPFRALYCLPSDNLKQVLQVFTLEHIHRLYIVDDAKKLLGVISLGDIIDVLDRLDLDL